MTAIVASIAFVVVGITLVALVERGRTVSGAALIGHSLGLGLSGMAGGLLLLSLLGLVPQPLSAGGICIAGILTLWQLKRRQQLLRLAAVPPAARPAGSTMAVGLVVASLVVALVAMRHGFMDAGLDAIAIWGLKAKAVYLAPLRDAPVFRAPGFSFSHLQYPLLVAFQLAAAYVWAGSPHVATGQVVFVLAYGGMGALAYAAARERLRPWPAAILALALAWLPAQMQMACFGYADTFFVLACLGNAWAAWRYLEHGERRDLVYFALYGAALALTKTEGLVTVAIHGTLLLALTPGRRPRLAVLAAGAVLLAAIAPVWLWLLSIPAHEPSFSQNLNVAFIGANTDRLGYILRAWFQQMTTWRYWGGWFFLPLVVAVLGPAAWRRRGTWWLWAALLGQAAFYCLVYLITPRDLAWHVRDSIGRLFLHLTPLVFLIAVAHLSDLMPAAAVPAPAEPEPADDAADAG